MPGKRQPTDLIKANRRKHLSKAEEAARRATEPQVEAPDVVTAPEWLAKRFHREFLEIGGLLCSSGLYTELDRDVLGQYFLTRDGWLKTYKIAAAASRSRDEKLAQIWTGIQNTYFRQTRQCSETMGLSINSRCKLVVPESAKPKEDDNQFLQLISGGLARNA